VEWANLVEDVKNTDVGVQNWFSEQQIEGERVLQKAQG
jgi:hypothetical protein